MKKYVKLTILSLFSGIFLVGCKGPTKSIIFKPNSYETGYIMEIPTPFEFYVCEGQPDRFYDYVFFINNGDEILFISNNKFIRNEFSNMVQDTVIEEGMDNIRRNKGVKEDTLICHSYRYWKTIYILGNQRHNSLYFYPNIGISKITYGYCNVKRKDKKKYDKILQNVKILADTSIIVDSLAILLDL